MPPLPPFPSLHPTCCACCLAPFPIPAPNLLCVLPHSRSRAPPGQASLAPVATLATARGLTDGLATGRSRRRLVPIEQSHPELAGAAVATDGNGGVAVFGGDATVHLASAGASGDGWVDTPEAREAGARARRKTGAASGRQQG